MHNLSSNYQVCPKKGRKNKRSLHSNLSRIQIELDFQLILKLIEWLVLMEMVRKLLILYSLNQLLGKDNLKKNKSSIINTSMEKYNLRLRLGVLM